MQKIEDVFAIVRERPQDLPLMRTLHAFGDLDVYGVNLVLEPGFHLGDFMDGDDVMVCDEPFMAEVTPPGAAPQKAFRAVWKIAFKAGGAALMALKVSGVGDDDNFSDVRIEGEAVMVEQSELVDVVAAYLTEQVRASAWEDLMAISNAFGALRRQLDGLFTCPDQQQRMKHEFEEAYALQD